jgi:arginyl-tRNA synthetase
MVEPGLLDWRGVARVLSERPAEIAGLPDQGRPLEVGEPAERALAIELLGFGDLVGQVAESLELHRLAGYLYDVATAFTAFYEQCPVLQAEEPVRRSRLGLCDLSARVLARGLDLLGVEAPQEM